MTDIVTRLRSSAVEDSDLLDAADEIERLRKGLMRISEYSTDPNIHKMVSVILGDTLAQ